MFSRRRGIERCHVKIDHQPQVPNQSGLTHRRRRSRKERDSLTAVNKNGATLQSSPTVRARRAGHRNPPTWPDRTVWFDWLCAGGTSAAQSASPSCRDRRRPRRSALLLDATAVYGFGRLSGKLARIVRSVVVWQSPSPGFSTRGERDSGDATSQRGF
jgi:hypothetical protein